MVVLKKERKLTGRGEREGEEEKRESEESVCVCECVGGITYQAAS